MLFNLPNILTFSRILAIPVIIGLLLLVADPLGSWLAFSAYTYACLTDFFDGYVARAWHLQSAFGRFLDPIADKLLIASVLLMLVGIDRFSGLTVLPAAVILCREILVSGLREFLAEVPVRVPVTTLAKWKTTIQLIAIALFILPPLDIANQALIASSVWWIATLLTLVTGYGYVTSATRRLNHRNADQ